MDKNSGVGTRKNVAFPILIMLVSSCSPTSQVVRDPNFDLLEVGMSRNEVSDILGRPVQWPVRDLECEAFIYNENVDAWFTWVIYGSSEMGVVSFSDGHDSICGI